MQQRTKDIGPAVSEEELAMLGWFRKLSANERAALEGSFKQEYPPVGASGLEALLQDFAQELRNLAKARRTVEIYLADLSKFQRYLNRTEQDITELDVEMVRGFTKWLAAERYARLSISRMLTALRGFSKFLYREGVLGLPQMPRAQPFYTKVPKGLPEYLSEQEVARLLDEPDTITPYGLRDRAHMEVLYGAGLRVAELCDLDLEDLNLERMSLFVRNGKGGKQRLSFYGEPCLRAINRYLEEARPYMVQGKITSALFLNRYGRRISYRSVEKSVAEYARLAGLRRVWPHLLRHSYASHMTERGAGLMQLKTLLGHSSVSTTQVYVQVTEIEAQKTFERYHPRSGGGGRK